MHIPRRGEIAVYVAKQFDAPFGAEQRKFGRLKEGRAESETANELAKLLVRRITRLVSPEDESSLADKVERKLPEFTYRMIFNEAGDMNSPEFLVRDGAKFFTHHSELAARTRELPKGRATRPSLELDIYLCFFALPILANNLSKYSLAGKLFPLPGVSVKHRFWFLPDIKRGRKDCITPMANALTWLRWQLGGQKDRLEAFLCPRSKEDSPAREIEKWRAGDVIPSAARIAQWSEQFTGDRRAFKIIFNLGAAMTRAWRHAARQFGYRRAIALNNHLLSLMRTLQQAAEQAVSDRPNFEGQPPEVMRYLRWLYSGPQSGPFSRGPNYVELTAEIHAAFLAGISPIDPVRSPRRTERAETRRARRKSPRKS